MTDELLEAAGNPAVLETRAVEPAVESEDTSLIATEARLENGTLGYAEVEGPSGREVIPGYIRFDTEGRGVPDRFQRTPGDSQVTLVYENGEVHPRRTLSERESRAIKRAVDIDQGAELSYDEGYNNVYVISEERGRFKLDLEQFGSRSFLHRPVTPAVESGRFSVAEVGDDEVTTQGDDCFDLFGPCPACVAGTVTCAACSITCATGPQCAACLILTCGFTGGACGCCAMCADGIPDPENAICPD